MLRKHDQKPLPLSNAMQIQRGSVAESLSAGRSVWYADCFDNQRDAPAEGNGNEQ